MGAARNEKKFDFFVEFVRAFVCATNEFVMNAFFLRLFVERLSNFAEQSRSRNPLFLDRNRTQISDSSLTRTLTKLEFACAPLQCSQLGMPATCLSHPISETRSLKSFLRTFKERSDELIASLFLLQTRTSSETNAMNQMNHAIWLSSRPRVAMDE